MQRSMIFVQAPDAWRVDAAITERVVWQAPASNRLSLQVLRPSANIPPLLTRTPP